MRGSEAAPSPGVDGVAYLGERTIGEIDALSPVGGEVVQAASAGTPSKAGSDLLAIGDLAEYDYDDDVWRKTVANASGKPPAGTCVLVASTVLSFTLYGHAVGHSAELARWDGTSVTPSFATPLIGMRVFVRRGEFLAALFSYLDLGAWLPPSVARAQLGFGIEDDGPFRTKSGELQRNLVDAVVAVADAGGGASATALTVDIFDLVGTALEKECTLLLYASVSQYGGPRDPNANVTLDTISKGSVVASSAANGWWLIKTDSAGQFACNANNDTDESVWFVCSTSDGGVEVTGKGVVVRGCVPDVAAWSV
jgi:hypothetical protein